MSSKQVVVAQNSGRYLDGDILIELVNSKNVATPQIAFLDQNIEQLIIGL